MTSLIKRGQTPLGLTPVAVENARQKYGSNELTQQKRNGFFRQLLSNFGDPIIKILLIALAINVFFMCRGSSWFESAGIAVAIFLATFVSTLSEYGSEAAFERLQEDAASIECRVRRAEGVVKIPIGDIVVGDLVLLGAGERIPADGILVSGELLVDQSALNGESREASKKTVSQACDTWELSAEHQLFRGSVVSSAAGADGEMLVKRVGDNTFYGSMAQQMQDKTRESPLKVRLNDLAGAISKLGYMAAGLVACADLFQSLILQKGLTNTAQLIPDLIHAATLAITVVVVAVPEGLPMMITVVLSSNMLRMMRDKVLVRKLVGIETSGSLNILFTDKTGTLTRGALTAGRFIAGDGTEYESPESLKRNPVLYELTELSCVLNNASTLSEGCPLGGNATDRALLSYVLPLKGCAQGYTVTDTIPFDSARKFSAVRIRGARPTTLVKGAPEKILVRCSRYYDKNGQAQPLLNRRALETALNRETENAVRVLALAATEQKVSRDEELPSMILIGLVCIRDQLRREAREAVRSVTGAGVQVVMITGDNRQTAAAVARETGLLDGGLEEHAILTSGELSALTDAQLKSRLPVLRVVARALPTDKTRLVQAAQEMGLVAGMTGDGINDAPALKKADVGFAMGSGTEVAKEAGDIVILDNNIASIARAILYGRTIFKSIRKFIVFQLTMNLCAVGVSIIGPLIGVDTPVTVMQMLWINMIMDTLAGLAFAGEPPLPEYMKEQPKRRDEAVLNHYMTGQITCMGVFTIILCTLFLRLDFVRELFRYKTEPIYFMTAFFALFIFSGVFNSFNARTHRMNLLAHLGKNPFFVTIMLVVTAVQLLLIYYGGALFRTAGLTLAELAAVLSIAFLVIPADLIYKMVLKINNKERDF